MKKETLARILVILFIFIAVAIPFGGYGFASFANPNRIELHARMPGHGGWSMETIRAKAGQPVHLHMTSDDVVHGFAIGKSDQPGLEIIPGAYTDTTLTFDKPGKYTFYCTRWCGRDHWRMRGIIEVSGEGAPVSLDSQPLYVKLGLDLDAPPPAEVIPSRQASAERGAQFSGRLPAYAIERDTYLTTSPAKLWLRLRAEPALSTLSDEALWDAVAWVWQQQTTPEAVATGQKLYAANCAACHGETGKGNGTMVRGLPTWNPGGHTSGEMSNSPTGEGLFSPPDFSDPKQLLGASPALLVGKIIRGGMGTGMPYWGSIFTPAQIDALVAALTNFAWGASPIK